MFEFNDSLFLRLEFKPPFPFIDFIDLLNHTECTIQSVKKNSLDRTKQFIYGGIQMQMLRNEPGPQVIVLPRTTIGHLYSYNYFPADAWIHPEPGLKIYGKLVDKNVCWLLTRIWGKMPESCFDVEVTPLILSDELKRKVYEQNYHHLLILLNFINRLKR